MENLEKKFLSQEEVTDSHELQEKVLKKEAKIFNEDFNWSKYEQALENGRFSMIALFELFKGGVLKPEDITKVDVERMNELKTKENLSDEEKDELELRERGDLFYDKRREKYSAVNVGGMITLHKEGRIYKEVHYILESVKGFLDGEEVDLEKIEYDIEPASLKELREYDPEQAKLFERTVYRGNIGQRELSDEEARELLGKYTPFAKKRSHEVRGLIHLAKEGKR